MSQENAEIVLEGLRLYEANDMSAAAEVYSVDAWISGPEGWPEQGPFRGRKAVFDQFERLKAGWDEHRFVDVGTVAARGDWVVIRYTWEARGATSGIDTAFELCAAYRVIDGLITEAHFRWDEADALEAAGLSE